MKQATTFLFLIFLLANSCQNGQEPETLLDFEAPFFWENANLYFVVTDRFSNGDTSNDLNFNRSDSTATLRGFMGGDIQGITQKIEEGYFDDLGINAIWFTPIVEQNKGIVNEGSGPTYSYHGYWAQDWTSLDPNFGTEEDLANLVEKAHGRGIRILLDVVVNHTGPITTQDPVWSEWVRTGPKCVYQNYATTVNCTLVDNLPDMKTESNQEVDLPPFLKAKWEKEGRLEKELQELDEFFKRTGHPRAPRFYIMKWLTDYIRKYGVDGYRVDTAKHTEEYIWKELYEEAKNAFAEWKKANPDKVIDESDFYMVGEVYGYGVATDTLFDFGDKKVNYFKNGLTSLINFGFKTDCAKPYEDLFSYYSAKLNGPLKGKTFLNYISSHDDGEPFDKDRKRPFEAATKLMLCPGGVQVYYGDEMSRPLVVEGAYGDANLRSFMNWEDLEKNAELGGFPVQSILEHWQKLGKFRNAHPAVGAGVHSMISASPYYFKRTFEAGDFEDAVLVGLDLPMGEKMVETGGLFPEGAMVKDYYSGKTAKVTNGGLSINTEYPIVLFGK